MKSSRLLVGLGILGALFVGACNSPQSVTLSTTAGTLTGLTVGKATLAQAQLVDAISLDVTTALQGGATQAQIVAEIDAALGTVTPVDKVLIEDGVLLSNEAIAAYIAANPNAQWSPVAIAASQGVSAGAELYINSLPVTPQGTAAAAQLRVKLHNRLLKYQAVKK